MKKTIRLGKSIEIIPIASESFGVRSSAFYVKFDEILILLDPSVSLAPRRLGRPPHPLELLTAAITRKALLHLSKKANVIIISHYHGDHYTIPWKRYYEYSDYTIFEKTYFDSSEIGETTSWMVENHENEKNYFQNTSRLIIAKSSNNISWNQKKRARAFWEYNLPAGFVRCKGDGHSFYNEEYGLRIMLVGNISHGCDSKRGSIVMTHIVDETTGKSVFFSSDVEGPCDPLVVEKIKETDPEVIFLDGPAFYHPKFELDKEEQIIQNIGVIVDLGCHVFMDHHFNRSPERDAYCIEKYGILIQDFSRSVGIMSENLESKRKELWQEHPIRDFDAQNAWQIVSSISDAKPPISLETSILQHFQFFLKEC